jgi:hypothetical protein
MISTEASQVLIEQLQILAPHWEDASLFLEYAQAGLLTHAQIEEILRYIKNADQLVGQEEVQILRQKTHSILIDLRERERIDRLEEERTYNFQF